MTKSGHVGITALEAERTKLLAEFDIAIKQGGDDPTKTEHGNVGEASLRNFLQKFLPKKYGVTKGHIITPDLEYAGPLEQWDVIIYDQLESPVLFVRERKGDSADAGERGIPVEYVKAVIEVKASFNKVAAERAVEKLLKLRQFERKKGAEGRPAIDIQASAIFFDMKLKNNQEYLDALAKFAKVGDMNFASGLILRCAQFPEYSSTFETWQSKGHVDMPFPPFILKTPPYYSEEGEERSTVVITLGFGDAEFWHFMLDLVHNLNGHGAEDKKPQRRLSDEYGHRSDSDCYFPF